MAEGFEPRFAAPAGQFTESAQETVIRTVIASLVATVALCGTAQANVWSPVQTQTAITVADAHWPASPCAGREQITWVRAAAMADFAATAYPAQCAVTIAWNAVAQANRSPGFLCTVLEHEFGHLSGLGHSTDPNNVMFATVWKVSPDCGAALPAHATVPRAGQRATTAARAHKVGQAARSRRR